MPHGPRTLSSFLCLHIIFPLRSSSMMILASSLSSVDGKFLVMMPRWLMTVSKRTVSNESSMLCSSLQRPKAIFLFVSVWLPMSVRHRISLLSADSFPMYSKTIGGNLGSNPWTWRFKECRLGLRFRRDDPVPWGSSTMPNCTDE